MKVIAFIALQKIMRQNLECYIKRAFDVKMCKTLTHLFLKGALNMIIYFLIFII